ncbi:MAG: hypothetical protein WAV07_02225 [Candidatus Contendobacter sp.]
MNKWCLKSGLAALLGGAALIASAADPVAVLQQPQGKVFISQGKAMVPVQPGIAVYPGNRVVTAASGGVSVVYADGCKVILPENSLLVLGGPKQCEVGLARVRTIDGFQSARIGQAPDPVAKVVEGAGSVGGSPTSVNTPLYKDNVIKAGARGKVVIRYSNGCEATVEPNQSLKIGDPPVCEAALAGGGAGAGAGAGLGAGLGAGAWVVGGAGIVLVGAAIGNSNDDEDASGQ